MSTTKVEKSGIVPRPGAYHRGNLRQSLIAVGLQVIAEGGVRALTLREIGNRLGISRMAPYRHFKDKGALLAAITTLGFTAFTEALETAWRNAGPNWQNRADALGLAYVQFARENKAHFEVMFGGGGEPQYLDEAGAAVAEECFNVLVRLVGEGQQLGEIVEGNSVLLAQMIWATVHGISVLGLATHERSGATQSDFTLYCSKLLRTGLRPRND